MNDERYSKWKDEANENEIIKKHGDVLVNKKVIEKRKKEVVWGIIRDSFLIIFVLGFLLLFSFKVFYPENYKDLIETTNICEPFMNVTYYSTTNNNNTCICNNICEFPNKIKLEIVNSS